MMQEAWRKLLIPDAGYEASDLWQVLVVLNSMGLNLSTLTVMSGAIGLGLGFGLQKVVSNFISGIILLIDNSIKPACLLKGFGDSSVDLELRFWIRDPANGVSNIRSMVLLAAWDSFKVHGIEIPFPQRDLHLRSSSADFVSRAQPDPDLE